MTPNNSPEINQPDVFAEEQTTVVVTKPTVPVAEKRKPQITLVKRRRAGMFDTPEIIAVSVAGFLLLSVLLGYLFWLRPAQERLRQREQTRNQIEADYQKLKSQIGENQTAEGKVTDIVGSLDRFETNYLAPAMQGNSQLFGRLNELIRANGLRNTAGPDYAPLETVSLEKYDPFGRAAEAKSQELYPGTVVSVTVEGGYSNLRRFVSDLENSRQFIVIRSIEIESENNNSSSGGMGGTAQSAADNNVVRNAPPVSGIPSNIVPMPNNPKSINPRAPQQMQPQPQQPKPIQPAAPPRMVAPGGRGAVVSLKLELVTYFRRDNAAQAATRY